ncbi:Isotrichodermin C-15 hydroxylase [Elsinoe australis]|uniref:Isotrichodermin C-15 hydroxylase n=1 Tax=Elsinoe australis TaxID=40998 RepID=A0A2P7YN19_9PEZI|nr:Isotrichodermin C-15 hydroxylase [Elsinoe australis]
MALLQLLATTIVGAIGAQLIFSLLLTPLRSFPGPFLAKFTDLWRLYDVWTGRSEKTQTELHQKYGKAVRTGPNCVSISDPELIKVIYSSKDKWRKSEFYSVNDFVINGQTFSTTFGVRDEAAHSAMTRPVHKLYTTANVVRYEPLIDSAIDFFLSQLQTRFVDTKEPCSIDRWLHFVAWDTIAEMTFSRRFGFLEQGADIEKLIYTGKVMHEYMSVIGQIPLLDKVFAKNPVKPIGPPAFGAAAGFSAKQLAVRKSGEDEHNPDRPDFLDEFLEIQKASEARDDEVITWMLSNVLAGSDTVAISLRAVVYYLAKNQDCQAKLQAELEGAGLETRPKFKEVSELPYLGAVIREATRLHPGVAMLLERMVPEGGLKLKDGRFIPAGTIVGINPRVIHREKETFGEDAEAFRPERWLKSKGEDEEAYQTRVKKMRDADLTFGFGKRACSGKNVAIVEMHKIIARLYRTFDVKLVDPKKEWKIQASWFYFQEGIDVYLSQR